jgi:hypothetical protein
MNLPDQRNLEKNSVSPKRRRIIKGSAVAMPMVLTLRSGSAFAAVSLSTTDWCNAVRPSAHPNSITMAPDGWKRVETIGRNVTGIGPTGTIFRDPRTVKERWYPMTENNATGTPYMSRIKDDGTTVFFAVADYNKDETTRTEFTPTTGEFTAWVLVHVTAEGKWTKIVGYDQSGNLPFSTTSCFNSINAQ